MGSIGLIVNMKNSKLLQMSSPSPSAIHFTSQIKQGQLQASDTDKIVKGKIQVSRKVNRI